MTIQNRIVRAFLTPLALTALLISCAGDDITNPLFGSGCLSGDLKAGDDITDQFTAESCQVPNYWWAGDHVPYTTYKVSLEKGKGYWFYLHQIPAPGSALDDVDAVLVLFGKNEFGASVPLSASDDDGGGPDGHDSELYFIAAASGTYNLVASSYDFSELGGYQLRMETCPVVAKLTTAGTTANIPFPTTNCVRHGIANTAFTSPVVLVEIPALATQTIGATVTAAAMATAAEIGGPNWDVYDYVELDNDSDYNGADPSVLTVTAGAVDGSFTMAVGLSTGAPSGTFSVDLTKSAVAVMASVKSAAPTTRLIGGDPAKKAAFRRK